MFEVEYKYMDNNELYKLYRGHLHNLKITWKFNREV
jgi:hypothetical protein